MPAGQQSQKFTCLYLSSAGIISMYVTSCPFFKMGFWGLNSCTNACVTSTLLQFRLCTGASLSLWVSQTFVTQGCIVKTVWFCMVLYCVCSAHPPSWAQLRWHFPTVFLGPSVFFTPRACWKINLTNCIELTAYICLYACIHTKIHVCVCSHIHNLYTHVLNEILVNQYQKKSKFWTPCNYDTQAKQRCW